jgi:hypothetical protein
MEERPHSQLVSIPSGGMIQTCTGGAPKEDIGMRNRFELQVEFYSKDEAAINIQSRSPAAELALGEILLFCSFALRQMHNLGTNHPVSLSLARALASNQDPRTPLTLFVGPPDFSFRDISLLPKDEVSDPLKNYVSLDAIKLVPFEEQHGEKRFLATLDVKSEHALLRLHGKGFDLLGRGVNYYGPVSVGLLFRHLALLHFEDGNYLGPLSQAARLCGEALLMGKISVLSQPVLAFQIAADALRATG